ncbi:histidine phosphatase family protein [Actinokineospora iranica]|uniref:Probable phosphoglycerate mutase n=1 Tax=Actinokineospora iranica TaxID=1271860 RepID=A0A1G6P8I8_9PSEU|nr:histidine phosphatase family protein [Actinokineospora iranica]SDC76590.1 probable phosphoglycerate mutase [Actinokineospora iranica]
MSLRVMLIRHGETPANVRHVLDSRPPGPSLTGMGRRQAAALAERLADEPVAAVYASVATRARETAEPLAKTHGLPLVVVDGVHELQVGDLEGRSDDAAMTLFGQVFTRWAEGDLAAAMPGGESGEEIRARYFPALREIQDRHPDGLVLLVSHGGVIRLVADWLCDNIGAQLANARPLPNTGHVLMEWRGSGSRVGWQAGWHCLEWTGVDL